MAIIEVWSKEQEDGWLQWLSAQSPTVQSLAAKLDPRKLYLMKSTQCRVTIHSYNDLGLVGVSVTGRYNHIPFNHHEFGVLPADLVECDLPGPDEPLGVDCSTLEEVQAYLASIGASGGVSSAFH